MSTIIRELEQAGVMPLLLVIDNARGRVPEKGLVPRAIGITQGELNLAVEKLIKLELVKRVPSQMLPHTGDLVLADKGRSVAGHLAEIQLLLTMKSHSAMNEDLGNLPVARNLAEVKKRETASSKRDLVRTKTGGTLGQMSDEAQERTKNTAEREQNQRKG
jgi:hypothetical protein